MENDDRGTNQEIEGDDTRSDRSSELRVDLQNAEFPCKAVLRSNSVLKEGFPYVLPSLKTTLYGTKESL